MKKMNKKCIFSNYNAFLLQNLQKGLKMGCSYKYISTYKSLYNIFPLFQSGVSDIFLFFRISVYLPGYPWI